MFAAINRKFKQIFGRQEHMKTFKTYDRIEVNILHSFPLSGLLTALSLNLKVLSNIPYADSVAPDQPAQPHNLT